MRNSYVALALIIMLVAAAGSIEAQMGTGRVAGTVKDTEGNAIEGAKIVAEMTGSDFSLEATSDNKGRWAVIGFRKGSYSFTVSAPGHVPQQFNTSVSGLGKNPSLNVVLEKMSMGQAFSSGPAAELLNEANQLYDQKSYTEAIAKYEEVMVEFPTLYQIHLNMGNCYRDLGDTEKALAEYNIVLEQEPTHTGALVNLGDAMVRSGDLDEAVSYFEKAIEYAPEDEVLPFNVAEIYFDQGNVQKAIEYYERSATVKPDWPEPYLKVGYAYINMAQMDKAAEAFQKVLDVAPPESAQAQMAQAALSSIQPQD
jgi:Flp pilus assembly protein TadD